MYTETLLIVLGIFMSGVPKGQIQVGVVYDDVAVFGRDPDTLTQSARETVEHFGWWWDKDVQCWRCDTHS